MESEPLKTPPVPSADPVADLSHQVQETRNQIIKTMNMLGNLSAEIREIGRQHQRQQRLLHFNSATAYVLFLIIVSASFYVTYRSRMERVDFEKDQVLREHAGALNKLEGMRQAAEKRREAENKAAAFYRLSQSGQIQQALKQYPEVAQLPLSRVEAAVFQDWVGRSRSRLAYASYTGGMKAVDEKHWKRAAAEFQRSLGYVPSPPHEASLRYLLGVSLMKLGSYQEAALELERALGADAEKLVSGDIRFHLGTIYEQLGRRDKAKAAFSAYLKQHPNSPLSGQAKRRLNALK
jgi:tetratricopeptide (TPR) repeat protein